MLGKQTIQNKQHTKVKLEISANSDRDIEGALEVLKESALDVTVSGLEYLSLQGLSLTELHITWLTSLISRNKALISLEMGYCPLGEAAFASIAQALQHCSQLENLHLYGMQITNACMPALCSILRQGKIKHLIVGDNQIDTVGVGVLIQKALSLDPCRFRLESLSLSGNPIGDAGVLLLTQWLTPKQAHHIVPRLNALYLKNIQLGQVGIEALAAMLKTSHGLKSLAIDDNACNHFSLKTLLAALQLKPLDKVSLDPAVFTLEDMLSFLVNAPENAMARRLKQEAKNWLRAHAQDFTQKGCYEEALADYRYLIALNPKSAAIYADCGYVFLMQGQLQQAQEKFEQALQCEKDFLNALQGKALVYLFSGEKALAKNYFDWIEHYYANDGINEKGEQLALLRLRAETFFKRGWYECADETIQQVLAMKADDECMLQLQTHVQQKQREAEMELRNLAKEDIKTGGLLAEGGFGQVYQGEWQLKPVAIKKIDITKVALDERSTVYAEAKILWRCRQHPQLVKLLGVCSTNESYQLIMEFIPGGTLHALLDSSQMVTWQTKYQWIREISYGLDYLHSQHIIHGDLKSDNLLLDNAKHIKIADLGGSKMRIQGFNVSFTLMGKPVGGTLPYLAPELLYELSQQAGGVTFSGNAKTTIASDVYSYGIVLCEIANRQIPLLKETKKTLAEFKQMVCQEEKAQAFVDLNPQTPFRLKNVMRWCLFRNPDKRPKVREALSVIEQETQEFFNTTTEYVIR